MKIKIEKKVGLKEVRNFFLLVTTAEILILLGTLLGDVYEFGWDLMFWKYHGPIIETGFYTTVGFFILSVLLWIVLSIISWRKIKKTEWMENLETK